MATTPSRSRLVIKRLSKMFSSTPSTATEGLTFHMRPIPPKAHLHKSIPSEEFPKGYLLGGLHSGVKKKADVLDLALVTLDASQKEPAAAAGVFTRNASCAAPVLVCTDVLRKTGGRVRSVVVNSGCANAVTGTQGLRDAWTMACEADIVAGGLSGNSPDIVGTSESLVMSTGVIGQTLPIEKVVTGIKAFSPSQDANPEEEKTPLGRTFAHWERAARAFMTTDTFPKLRARSFQVGNSTYRLGGMSKGAGMIHPNMGPPKTKKELHATLLSLILTDAPVTPKALQKALTFAGDRSFNSISVDGDMSTNDTVLVMANGAAGGKTIDVNSTGFADFRDALTGFATELAQLVVRDGEGATKFVTITVEGAATYTDAHAIASRVSTSALVKTALYGEDANWGRILAAAGSVPPSALSTPLDASKISVSLVPSDGTSPLPLLKAGEPVGVDETRAKEILQREDIEYRVELGLGTETARYWTCDYSYEYVKINGDYRS